SAEPIFHADSEAVVDLAAQLPEDARGDVRWRLALLGMHLLLTDLGFDLETRGTILRKTRDVFATEFHLDANLKHALGTKSRAERKNLEALVNLSPASDGALAAGQGILRRRSERLAPILAELRRSEEHTSELQSPDHLVCRLL